MWGFLAGFPIYTYLYKMQTTKPRLHVQFTIAKNLEEMNYATTNGSCILHEDISSSPRLDGIRTLNFPSTSFSLAPRIILQPQSSQSSLLLSSRAVQRSAGTQSTRETMGPVVMAMKSMGVIGRQSTELQLVNYRENIKNTHTHTDVSVKVDGL